MVGSELNRTRGKRGGIPGDIGASSFPSSFCVASVSGSILVRSFTLIPRSLHRNSTETLASQAKSPLVFFLVNISPALFNLNAWNKLPRSLHFLAPGSLVSDLCQDPGAQWLLSLLVCSFLLLFFFIFADVYCHILHLRFFVVCSSPIRITLESKQIVPFSLRQSPLSTLSPLKLWQFFT